MQYLYLISCDKLLQLHIVKYFILQLMRDLVTHRVTSRYTLVTPQHYIPCNKQLLISAVYIFFFLFFYSFHFISTPSPIFQFPLIFQSFAVEFNSFSSSIHSFFHSIQSFLCFAILLIPTFSTFSQFNPIHSTNSAHFL